MNKKYIITYTRVLTCCTHTLEIEAASKYAAKKRFYQLYPRYNVVSVKEAE